MALSGSPEDSRRRPLSSRLHGFTFSSGGWGSHRLLRCVNLPEKDQEEEEDLRAVRGCLMEHYDVAVEKIERKAKAAAVIEEKAPDVAEEKASSSRPWNLRTRRAVCGAPGGCPTPAPSTEERKEEEGKRRELSLTLRPEEVEEDLRILLGEKFSRRKKRRRQSQKAKNLLDSIFPGAWLTEITPDTYKVTE